MRLQVFSRREKGVQKRGRGARRSEPGAKAPKPASAALSRPRKNAAPRAGRRSARTAPPARAVRAARSVENAPHRDGVHPRGGEMGERVARNTGGTSSDDLYHHTSQYIGRGILEQ